MDWLLLLPDAHKARELSLYIEGQREDFRALIMKDFTHAQSFLFKPTMKGLIFSDLLPSTDGNDILQALYQRPPLVVPRLVLITHGLSAPVYQTDAVFSADMPPFALAQALPSVLTQTPVLSQRVLSSVQDKVRNMLLDLGMSPTLKGFSYGVELTALAAVQPELISRLTHDMYPAIAQDHHVSPASIERCLRHAIESTWSRGNLADLFRLFGHSIDPEKGKPTNREFIAMLCEHVTRQID